MSDKPGRPVILFDGHCALCNRSVQFVVRHERQPLHAFVALQSEAAAEIMAQQGVSIPAERDQLNTVYLLDSEGLHRYSSAALRVAATLKFPWRWAAAFRLIPAPLRDAVYRSIGRRRYRWFGEAEYCESLQNVDPARLL